MGLWYIIFQEESSALCGRFGGDEFLVFLPETGDELVEKMERMLKRLKEYIQFPVADFCFCVSAGTASVPNDETDYNRLFQLADEVLYAAKRAGKKRLINIILMFEYIQAVPGIGAQLCRVTNRQRYKMEWHMDRRLFCICVLNMEKR